MNKLSANVHSITARILTLILLWLAGCTGGGSPITPSEDFGAYYTRISSGEEFEQYSRTGDYADIIVDLGEGNGKMVFWRGSSYLPYLETATGKQMYVDELVPRRGDGEGIMPDKTNTYSRVFIIESSTESAVIHWRYMPDFAGTNPHIGVLSNGFVDEYFMISSDGKVRRTMKLGTEKIDEWNDPLNMTVQHFTITRNGFSNQKIQEPQRSEAEKEIEGNPVVAEHVAEPVAWFRFDEGKGDFTSESIGGAESVITGHKSLWKKGMSGTALQFDGYNTTIMIEGDKAPEISEAITLESWVVIGAYPWSWCPIVQQADDVPEEVRMFQDGVDITELDLGP